MLLPLRLQQTPRPVAWSVLPLVAGLFVVVEAVNRVGVLDASRRALSAFGSLPPWLGDLAGAFGVAALSNVINNLPGGLITGAAVVQNHVSESLRNALLIGVDLGPNLSVTGSLATILWLIALRREKQEVSAWSFLKVGLVVTPAALVAGGSCLHFPSRQPLISFAKPIPQTARRHDQNEAVARLERTLLTRASRAADGDCPAAARLEIHRQRLHAKLGEHEPGDESA